MLYLKCTLLFSGLMAASGWVIAPQASVGLRAPAASYCPVFMQADEVAAAAAPVDDFAEDLLDALAADDTPLSEMDAPPVFVKAETEAVLEPRPAYVNALGVEETRDKYKKHAADTGSATVQIAVLSARIAYMTKHMQENKKDYASLRGLQAMVTRRRKLLEYLLKHDVPEFYRLTSELEIRTTGLLKPKLSGARGRRVV